MEMSLINRVKNKMIRSAKVKRRRVRAQKDIESLAAMIEEEEKRKKEMYCRIGQLYMTIHQEDAEKGFEELTMAIAKSDSKIRAYRKAMDKCARSH